MCRKKILLNEIESYFKNLIFQIANEKGFQIETIEALQMWNPSYYVETIGDVSEDSIKKYIEGQDK